MKRTEPMAAEVCTTQKAAELLGISVTSVQQLVEAGVIEAWKTPGGHRRIPLAAVQAYKAMAAAPLAAAPLSPPAAVAAGVAREGPLALLVVEDNPLQRALYERQFAAWSLPLALRCCDTGYQALIEIARDKPDVLLADIVMDGMDGYEVMRTIQSYPELADMQIAIVSGVPPEELERRGGVPPGVVFFPKPVNFDELRGYLRACYAYKQKLQI